MKFFLHLTALLFLSFYARAQEMSPFTLGFEQTIPSKILGQKRTLLIHIPASNGGNRI
ncbi:hypothetical protein [Hymenobacter volaticus]|uniref:Alpha/beta hydrolase n=1 Tax=Hymenobacter volaticus TaxID=2932254 RepID=A0ABY4GGN7_9BACT|nr:hypothetical protein [Hymenobacter volaticus]UOQ69459.1 hypothetical protein MUN86_28690 [Hymenobacter volaticus]